MNSILLLTIGGPDHAGVTSAFTGTLAQHGVNVLDIGQPVIHQRLTLGMPLEVIDELAHAAGTYHEVARHSISTLGLVGILYLLGVRNREIPA